jgi:uncharacterized protein YbbC (DUF1343 family)
MIQFKKLLSWICVLLIPLFSKAQEKEILPAAWCMENYLPLLQGKKVALLINQTSVVGTQSLLDTLLKKQVNIVKVFVPEHGFRGIADAGAHINNEIDSTTSLPLISLYGNNKKTTTEQLADIDIVVYDLQDVGVRFYTYISSLEYLMEACAENNKQLLVLDRPNPNGFYVDGPLLQPKFKSFVGMQPIPIVYGMTVGEYAKMLKGEKWFKEAEKLQLTVVQCRNYDHKKLYALPIAPSPNLKNMAAVYLYPSLCLFEGTVVSLGRGTDKPFQQFGHPSFKERTSYFFTPTSKAGASKPLLEGQNCFGEMVAENATDALKTINKKLELKWLMKAYKWYPAKKDFFIPFFEKIVGNNTLQQQIVSGKSDSEIRKYWQKDLITFKKIRRKYLLYKDFE